MKKILDDNQPHHCRVASRSEERRGGGKKAVSNWFQNLYVRAIVWAVCFYGKSSTIILTGENLAQETHCSRKVQAHYQYGNIAYCIPMNTLVTQYSMTVLLQYRQYGTGRYTTYVARLCTTGTRGSAQQIRPWYRNEAMLVQDFKKGIRK